MHSERDSDLSRAFPPGPWPLERSSASGFSSYFLLLVVCWGIAAALYHFHFEDVWAIGNDKDLWEGGQPASEVRVEGSEQSRGFFVASHAGLDVRYVAQGKIYEGDLSLWLLFDRLDHDADPEVRYDPEDPTRFVLGWQNEVSGGRWRFKALMLLPTVLLVMLPIWAFRSAREDLQFRRACAADPEVIALPMVGDAGQVFDDKGKLTDVVRYSYDLDGRVRYASFDRKSGYPLMLDDETLIGARSRGGSRVLVLTTTLRPFAFSAEQRAQIQRALASPRQS